MKSLLNDIRKCRLCEEHPPSGCNPVIMASTKSKIVVIGQAPGRRVHESGIPWDDPSGDNLRNWLGVTKKQFYNPDLFALMPMGFCYPGTGKSGDLPPRPECAPLWHTKLMNYMEEAKLILLLGSYAQKYYLGSSIKPTLTETVKNHPEYAPRYLPLPHPHQGTTSGKRKIRGFKVNYYLN